MTRLFPSRSRAKGDTAPRLQQRRHGKVRSLPSYEGQKHPLRQMGEPIKTNTIKVTHTYGPMIKATFTNGILSTQNLVQQLSVNKAPPNHL
jgi:hypothetical protein